MRNFKKLEIWKIGFQIAVNCFKIVEGFPPREKFGLCIQVTKAGVSIPSNVAEGSSRHTDKDKKRFIEHSLGSAFELETQLLLAKAVNYGDQPLVTETLGLISLEQKMLSSFIDTLKD
jgi:four helix bundle protein